MKITRIELQRVRRNLDVALRAAWDPVPRTHLDATIVRVHTDAGLTGIGSGDTMEGFAAFAHLFIDSDPLALARHGRTLETIAFHAGRYWPLEAALWDLAGQALGVPVAALLGNARTRIPAYASWAELRSPEQRGEDAQRLLAENFRAVKVRIARDRTEQGVAVVAAIRAAAGERLTILVDLNQAWRMPGDIAPGLDPVAAGRLIDALAELDVYWVEEPLASQDLSGLRRLRDRTGRRPRIAGGEMATSFDELHRALEADVLDVVQPDVVLALGIGATRTLAELALRRNRSFTPHTWSNGIGLLANLHTVCGVGGGPFLEYPYDPPSWTPADRDFMLATPIVPDPDGCLTLPDRPGLGIELDEAAIAHHARELTA
jgi:D-galactarolactone cycloisomerase